MAILNNSNAISSGGYDINNSLRFRSSASAYLNRTPASAGNRQIFTFSYWLKRGSISVDQQFYGIPSTVTTQGAHYRFNSTDNLRINDYTNGVSDQIYLVTTQVFRDPSAWYHIVLAVDTTQATSTNRVKLYVNGTQVTSFTTATYPSQNQNLAVNQALPTYIGYGDSGSGGYFDGYMTDINFISGQALTPSSFGETDTTTGSWKPKAYSGTFGTTGFYLKFSDIATTSGSNAGLGKDFSGNTNYWTTNNISVTAGTTYDAMIDSPTLTSATVANYATLNPLGITASSTTGTANGNLQYASTGNSTGQQTRLGSLGLTSGKWYFEWIQSAGTSTDAMGGFANSSFNLYSGNPDGDSNCWGFMFNNGVPNVTKKNGGTATQIFGAAANNDVMMIAVDLDALKIWVGKNGTWSESGVPSTGTNAQFTNLTSGSTWFPFVRGTGGTGATSTVNVNFGQQPFSYTPPTGFVRLNTYNLPDSTIKKGNTVMDATLYTGTGSAQTITNAGSFKPDFVWQKARAEVANHRLVDSVRGVDKVLYSSSTAAEATTDGVVDSFNSNGFTGGGSDVVSSAQTAVAWQWQAGQGSTSSNTSGTITSTVSVNATAGFSVVTYTGIGSSPKTVGHGLGVAPKMIILKSRGAAVNWYVWHTSLGATQAIEGLNTTAAASTQATFNSTLPTSSVISLGNNDSNNSGSTYVLYVWAEIAGFSKFGSYTGNGSTDGPFVYTGFRPKFILAKRTDTAGFDWIMTDSSRSPSNVVDKRLFGNTNDAESSATTPYDYLSNGFKLRNTNANENASGGTYIYMAFAENPFKNANAR
jgi:hypothetical protein